MATPINDRGMSNGEQVVAVEGAVCDFTPFSLTGDDIWCVARPGRCQLTNLGEGCALRLDELAQPVGDSLRLSDLRKGRQLEREAAQHTSSLTVGLKRKQEQGASSNLVSIVRGKIRQFAAIRIVSVEQTVPALGPGHLG